ncbi:class I SAM-dependent methyltransferase [Pseudobacteriovorax antillogorgiicola]|uniref:Methyltransferase domain-containing protein n=1 Tax=Pseudobacteriovorax antillogorgiicola TaxID=1513793 RepID=A0A1Y6CJL9_9BACT|nr:class I SAM-dependent methyltransferase [Pseudobacteriovorax antillogorgiicola]TCS46200.1 methyltransferase family protein [Pseudobacteriovorax antillogorgiicola]SMF70533.1 Methyltransferase domain-containing protein [Pseudobacteriovorax antillogorgiicola]
MSQDIPEIYANYNSFRPEASGSKTLCYFTRNMGALLEESKLGKDANILEIGPGKGELLNKLRGLGYSNLEAFDICASFRENLRSQGFKVYDGNNLLDLLEQLPDNYFDALIAVDVLEHIDRLELQEFLKSFSCKLKSGGVIMGQVPNSSGLFGHNTFIADYTHITPFNEIRLTSLFHGCGYKNILVRETRLPKSVGNFFRSIARNFIFKIAYFLNRLVGATPVKNLSHLILFHAEK